MQHAWYGPRFLVALGRPGWQTSTLIKFLLQVSVGYERAWQAGWDIVCGATGIVCREVFRGFWADLCI